MLNNDLDLQRRILWTLERLLEGQGTSSTSTNVNVTNNPLPVSLTSGNVSITGPITVSNEVEIKNDIGNPIPVNGTISVGNQLTNYATETTLSSIDSKLTSPISVQSNNLDIRDLQFSTDKVDVSGSSINVGNFPTTQQVSNNGTFSVQNTTSIPAGSNNIGSITNITGTIPLATNAATDRTLATSPFSNRLSDGTNFYDARIIRPLTASDVVTIIPGTTIPTSNNDNRYEHFLAVSKEDSEPCIIRYTYDLNGSVIARELLDVDYNVVLPFISDATSHPDAIRVQSFSFSNNSNGNNLINQFDFIEYNNLNITYKTGYLVGFIDGQNYETVYPNIFCENSTNSEQHAVKYEITYHYNSNVNRTYFTIMFNMVKCFRLTVRIEDNTQFNGYQDIKLLLSTNQTNINNNIVDKDLKQIDLNDMSSKYTQHPYLNKDYEKNAYLKSLLAFIGGDADTTILSQLQSINSNLSSNGANTNVVGNVNQTIGTSGFNRITDGTNTVNVKPSSTAAISSDNALVVTMSPNSVATVTSNTSQGSVIGGTSGTSSLLTGLRYNTTQPTLTNGQQVALQGDINGKLQTVANLGATVYVQSTGNNTNVQLTAGSSFTGTIESALSYPQAIISLRNDVPITLFIDQFSDVAGTISFPTITYTLIAGQGFNNPVTLSGSFYRIRLTNTGTTTSTSLFLETWLGIIPPTPNLTLNNNLPVEQLDVVVVGQTAQTAIVNNILTPISGTNASDTLSYRSASVQVNSTGTGGTFIFEGSNDNINFQPFGVFNKTSTSGTIINTAITASVSQIVYLFPIDVRFIRLRIVTAITGGSIQAFTRYSQQSFQPLVNQVSQNTATSLNVSASQSGTWNTIPVPSTIQGFTLNSMIVSAATVNNTLVKNSAGVISNIVVGSPGNTVGSGFTFTHCYIKLYNKATAPIAGTDVPFAVYPIISGTTNVIPFPMGLRFTTGIGYAITRNASLLDNTAINATEVVGTITYI